MERRAPKDAAASADGERLREARAAERDAAKARRAVHWIAVRQRRWIQQKQPAVPTVAKSAGAAEAADAGFLAFPYPETRGADGGPRESDRAAAAKRVAPGGRERWAMREPWAWRARAASAERT